MNLIERIAIDKFWPLIAGLFAFSVGGILSMSIGGGAALSVIVGALKACDDNARGEPHDPWDAAATAAPGVLIWLGSLLL